MWFYPFSSCTQPIIAIVLIVVSFVYWFRSRRRGFLWIGAAHVLLLTTYLLSSLTQLIAYGPRSWGWYVGLLTLCGIVFHILIFVGLQSFYAESRVAKISARPAKPIPWHVVSLVIRRLFFIAIGSIFILVGPIVAFSNRTSVGVGCVTALMGIACLWLGLHPRSPLVKTKTEKEESESDHERAFDEQEPREDIEQSNGSKLDVHPLDEER